MRNLIGCTAVLFVIWLMLNLVALILALLFSNLVTGTITFLGFFAVAIYAMYKVTAMWLDEMNKGE